MTPTPVPSAGRPRATALAAVLAVLVGVAACRAASGVDDASAAAPTPMSSAAATPAGPADARSDALGRAGGRLPDGATVRDDRLPGVARLDPALREALRAASADAARDGVRVGLTSGWRSRAYQAHLLDDAVSEYGSRAEAARWVATPSTSPHVTGDAVDVGPTTAMDWMARHGADHDLCVVYANEPWHLELRAGAHDHGCPAPYADPTHDPRMSR